MCGWHIHDFLFFLLCFTSFLRVKSYSTQFLWFLWTDMNVAVLCKHVSKVMCYMLTSKGFPISTLVWSLHFFKVLSSLKCLIRFHSFFPSFYTFKGSFLTADFPSWVRSWRNDVRYRLCINDWPVSLQHTLSWKCPIIVRFASITRSERKFNMALASLLSYHEKRVYPCWRNWLPYQPRIYGVSWNLREGTMVAVRRRGPLESSIPRWCGQFRARGRVCHQMKSRTGRSTCYRGDGQQNAWNVLLGALGVPPRHLPYHTWEYSLDISRTTPGSTAWTSAVPHLGVPIEHLPYHT